MANRTFERKLPKQLEGLSELALDLRWARGHVTDTLWQMLDPETWERTRNPYMILQNVSQSRLEEVMKDPQFDTEVRAHLAKRKEVLASPGWFGKEHTKSSLKAAAYFSMEFGLSESLPIYSGGLGILAGDHLKSASDLGVPVIGIGLLYQQGYFRQVLGSDGAQLEAFPYNDPSNLPVMPMLDNEGGRLRFRLPLPGRTLFVKVWQVQVGKVPLYLLDSNDPLNSPWDRAITANLYAGGRERRLIQELILGIGGWMALQHLGIEPEVCHMNEGHAAFVVVARAASYMKKFNVPFSTALAATRAGNIFTTHTPVAAAFDRFEGSLLYPFVEKLSEETGIDAAEIMRLGRRNPDDMDEPFNMAYLALNGSCTVNAVSELHGAVSRKIFHNMLPGWPEHEVPVGHVTNGVHVPTWDSPSSSRLWTETCGHDPWSHDGSPNCEGLNKVSDSDLWQFRAEARKTLVDYVRRRLVRQVESHGGGSEAAEAARHALDPNALTIGLARRFTAYKRPTLILSDPDRLARLLTHYNRPVQLIVAGKSHPDDTEGKMMVQAMARFASRPELRGRLVFLEDYDMSLAHQLVTGVDLWLNLPRRPWEACGTSGMKVLCNGGLNLSVPDGWWAEAYSPEVGWALGDGSDYGGPQWDVCEAMQLYDILETEVVPEFYDRDDEGLPKRWITRVRRSMTTLTGRFSSHRMVRDYVNDAYVPAAKAYIERTKSNGKLASEIDCWQQKINDSWRTVRFGDVRVRENGSSWHFEVQVYFGDVPADAAQVQLYAEPTFEDPCRPIVLQQQTAIAGAVNGYIYCGDAPAHRPVEHYTPRVVAWHPKAFVPAEESHILWQR
jgi:starch phosphorylase